MEQNAFRLSLTSKELYFIAILFNTPVSMSIV